MRYHGLRNGINQIGTAENIINTIPALMLILMKRKLKQWLSTIPSISTKRTFASHLNSLNITKTVIYDVGKSRSSLGTGIPMWQG